MPMRVFLQPLEDQAGPVVTSALTSLTHAPARATIVVAWAKMSGVLRLEESLRAFIQAGGVPTFVVGIDQRGTTREALQKLVEIGCELYVYHDEPSRGSVVGRSFHPKVFMVRDRSRARILLGSGNLTAGGLYNNYEWFVDFDLDLTARADVRQADAFADTAASLMSDWSTCVRFDAADLPRLLAQYAGWIPSERRAARERSANAPRPASQRMFGARLGLPMAPPMARDSGDRDAPVRVARLGGRRTGPRTRRVIGSAAGLHRVVQQIGRGRPGQVQLRRAVADWVFGGRPSKVFERAEDGVRARRPLVTTHTGGGAINTVRVELSGFDQNVRPQLAVLEQLPDGAILWDAIPLDDPRAAVFLALLPARTGHTMPGVLQELGLDGRWRTTNSL
jgi:HKD family nuclease